MVLKSTPIKQVCGAENSADLFPRIKPPQNRLKGDKEPKFHFVKVCKGDLEKGVEETSNHIALKKGEVLGSHALQTLVLRDNGPAGICSGLFGRLNPGPPGYEPGAPPG